jgi:nucleoid-associated protein EbfC
MNIKQMMKQAQAMQDKVQAELAAVRIQGSAGGGAVTVAMNGIKEVLEVKIDKETVDPSDLEMLQDLIVAACRDASARVDETVSQKTNAMLGSMMPRF